MCTEEKSEAIKDWLEDIWKQGQPRDPIDKVEMVQATLAWPLDYHERKHCFLWIAATTTLDFETYGSGSVQGQIWNNLGMRPGTKITAPSAGTTPVVLNLRFTDEVIP